MKIVTITPHRDRLPQFANHLRSLAYQTRPPDQAIVSSHGDTQETRRAIVDLMHDHLDAAGVPKQFWSVGEPADPWRKPLCVNFAVRRTAEDVDVVATFDVDMILHPETLAEVERVFAGNPRSYVMCPNRSLPPGAPWPGWTYDELRSRARTVTWEGKRSPGGPPSEGWGAMQAATREWWFDVRGLDEDMELWGSEDHDLLKRAKMSGLTSKWLPRELAALHQWHEAHQNLKTPEIKRAKARNHLLSTQRLKKGQFRRNSAGWGVGSA